MSFGIIFVSCAFCDERSFAVMLHSMSVERLLRSFQAVALLAVLDAHARHVVRPGRLHEPRTSNGTSTPASLSRRYAPHVRAVRLAFLRLERLGHVFRRGTSTRFFPPP
jgi:hypothetical protein